MTAADNDELIVAVLAYNEERRKQSHMNSDVHFRCMSAALRAASAARDGASPDPVGWDDRKELLDIWQEYAPLPDVDLREGGIFEALIAVAGYGVRRAKDEG